MFTCVFRPFYRRLFYYNPCSYYLPRRYGVATLAFLGFCNVYALRVNLSVAIVAMSTPEEFGWGSETQGMLLATFFYGYIVTQIPGGWLSNRFGGKKVRGRHFTQGLTINAIAPQLYNHWLAAPLFRCSGTGCCARACSRLSRHSPPSWEEVRVFKDFIYVL